MIHILVLQDDRDGYYAKEKLNVEKMRSKKVLAPSLFLFVLYKAYIRGKGNATVTLVIEFPDGKSHNQ